MRTQVSAAIAAHIAAVQVDEASYTADGKPLLPELVAATAKVEGEAFGALVREPCRSAQDVQAKLRYVLDGTIGERQPNVSGILGEDGCDLISSDGPLLTFLRSLVTDATEETAPQKVGRLISELREALAACDQGPLRATIDSDGNAIVQPLAGLPLFRGERIVGVSTLMFRTIYGPERQPRDIPTTRCA